MMLALATCHLSLIFSPPRLEPASRLRVAARAPPCSCEIPAGIVVTVASGLAIFLRPDSALWGLIDELRTPIFNRRLGMSKNYTDNLSFPPNGDGRIGWESWRWRAGNDGDASRGTTPSMGGGSCRRERA